MTSRLIALFLITFCPALAFAQGASLTIFSEDGDKFILFLNGQQQNSAGQTNLRIDGLSQAYYKARIVFEDKAKGQVDKNLAVNDPATNAPADVVYRIKNKGREMKLRYYSAQPIQPNYVAPPDMYVVHYGQPEQTTTTTQTTVTQTGYNSNPSNGGVSIGINTPVGGVNINVNDPNMNGGVSQQTTTTTTTTSSYSTTTSNSGYNTGYNNNEYAPAPCQYPMNPGNFKSAKQTVVNASFEDTKLSTAKGILASNCLNTEQVVQICQLFGFEETKLSFAKFAYSRTTDQKNYFKVNNVFTFDESRTDLNNFISGGR